MRELPPIPGMGNRARTVVADLRLLADGRRCSYGSGGAVAQGQGQTIETKINMSSLIKLPNGDYIAKEAVRRLKLDPGIGISN